MRTWLVIERKDHKLTILRIWSFKCSDFFIKSREIFNSFYLCGMRCHCICRVSSLYLQRRWYDLLKRKKKKKERERKRGGSRREKKEEKRREGGVCQLCPCEYKKILAIIIKQYNIWKWGIQGSFLNMSALCSLYIRKLCSKEGKCTHTLT